MINLQKKIYSLLVKQKWNHMPIAEPTWNYAQTMINVFKVFHSPCPLNHDNASIDIIKCKLWQYNNDDKMNRLEWCHHEFVINIYQAKQLSYIA